MTNQALSKPFALRVAVAALLLVAFVAFAQEQPSENHGSVEIGVRQNWGTVYGRSNSTSLFPSFPSTTGGPLPMSSGPFLSRPLGYEPGFGNSSYFQYRDMPNGFFVKSFAADLDNVLGRNLYIKAQGRDGVEKDQTYLLTVGQYGKAKFQFRWDDTPHTFTDTAQTLFTQPAAGFFAISSPVQTTLAAGTSNCTYQQITAGACALTNTVNSVFSNVAATAIALRRRSAGLSFAWTPTERWDLLTSYTHEDASGARPFSTVASSNNGGGFEFPEPIKYRTQQIKVGADYNSPRWELQFGYAGSLFDNRIDSLTYVSPFNTNTAANQSRIDLYPSNTAHSVHFAGALLLSKYVQLLASIVPGWISQNDLFLPYTINSGTTGCPGGPCNSTSSLPAQSYHGSKNTLAMNYTLATRPIHKVSFVARYRSYDYNNDSPMIAFPGLVVTDGATFGSGGENARVSVPRSFFRKNLEFEGTLHFRKDDNFKIGYTLERLDRTHRDVSRTQEGTFLTSVDFNPDKKTLVRLSYKHSDRTPSDYKNNDESYVNGEAGTAQLFAFRRFDEAQRTRDRGEALLQYSPLDTLTFSAVFSTDQNAFAQHLTPAECAQTNDEAIAQAALSSLTLVAPFNPSCLSYGLLKDISSSYSFDVNYSPIRQLNFFGEFAHERFNYQQRSRDRTYVSSLQAAPAVIPGKKGAYDDPSNDWFSWTNTHINTYSGGVDVYMARRKVALTSFYSLSDARGDLLTTLLSDSPTMNPATVTTAALVTASLAGGPGFYNYPSTTNRLHQLCTSLKFNLTKNLSPRIEYRFERYDQHDWQSDIMMPYMSFYDPGTSFSTSASRLGGGTQKWLYLGADTPSYKSHVLSGSLEWRF